MEKGEQNSTPSKFWEEKIKKNIDKDFNCNTILYEAMKCYIIFDSASVYFCKDPFQKYITFCHK
jgi:hypothetical protein